MKKLNKIEQQIVEWNEQFPVDRWWREKHNIAFMSPAHRDCSFLDQLFEYEEERLIQKYKEDQDKYIPNQGDFIKIDKNDKSSIIKSMKEEFESRFIDGQDS